MQSSRLRKLSFSLSLILSLILVTQTVGFSQKRRPAASGNIAVVVDERLAALRD